MIPSHATAWIETSCGRHKGREYLPQLHAHRESIRSENAREREAQQAALAHGSHVSVSCASAIRFCISRGRVACQVMTIDLFLALVLRLGKFSDDQHLGHVWNAAPQPSDAAHLSVDFQYLNGGAAGAEFGRRWLGLTGSRHIRLPGGHRQME